MRPKTGDQVIDFVYFYSTIFITNMLAFDIETTGLDGHTCDVTAACIYNSEISETFLFPEPDLAKRERFMAALDSAPRLCSFNGIRFDIPFLHAAWRIPDRRVEAWALKTFDVYEACKLSLNCTFSLDRLLFKNKLESKTGSGLHAIHLAKTGQWEELGNYCMQDTRMTFLVSSLPEIHLPDRHNHVLMPDPGRPFVRPSLVVEYAVTVAEKIS